MPTYQYSCTDCGHFFEIHQSFSEDSLTVCPNCEGKLRKVFNAVGVVFKGSGFYRNDSRGTQSSSEPGSSGNGSSGNGSSGSGSESGSKGSSEKGPDKGSEKKSSTESKPAAKSESSSSAPA